MARIPYVDQEACIGCQLCVENLPDVFRMNDDGKAEVHNPTGASEDQIESEAVAVCPVTCIHWE